MQAASYLSHRLHREAAVDLKKLLLLRARASEAMDGRSEADNLAGRDIATELSIYHAELEAQHEELIEANLLIGEQLQGLTALFDEAPVAYFIVEGSLSVIRWNDKARALGFLSSLTPGVFITNLLVSKDRLSLREWLLNDRVTDPLLTIACHNPDLFCQLDKKIMSGDKKLISVTDVSLQRRSYQEAQVQRSQAFAYLAHELRTPVATIAMTIDADSEYAATSNGKVIKAATEQTLSIMEDLRTVLSPDTDTYALRVPIELRSLVNELIAISRPQLDVRNIQTHVNAAGLPAGEVWLTASERAIRQILTNLLKNVAVHSRANNAWISVHLEESGEGFNVVFTVSDDGVGIPAEDRARIFLPFQQGMQSGGGMGIGLDLSRKLAELIGGTLSLEQREGGGSCFTLSFLAESFNKKATAAVPSDLSHRLEGMYVLVVEDDANIRRLTRTTLRKAGATVEVAADGVEGIAKLEQSAFDLLVVDFMMPRMNGVAFIEAARASGFDGKIVGCTAAMLGDDSEHMLLAGANAVIHKPLSLQELTKALG